MYQLFSLREKLIMKNFWKISHLKILFVKMFLAMKIKN